MIEKDSTPRSSLTLLTIQRSHNRFQKFKNILQVDQKDSFGNKHKNKASWKFFALRNESVTESSSN